MSFTSGIGTQQAANAITPSEAQPVVSANGSGAVIDRSEISNATVGHADETALSSAGGLVAQSLEVSDTRTAKVLSLQQAISTGNYTVPSSDVADKIIQSLLE
jgi:negative regulator of flagellin synthesis FlgM